MFLQIFLVLSQVVCMMAGTEEGIHKNSGAQERKHEGNPDWREGQLFLLPAYTQRDTLCKHGFEPLMISKQQKTHGF